MSEAVDVLAETIGLLTTHRTISLATIDSRGLPHACNVQVAFDRQPRLYFLSSPRAAHTQHLLATGCAAVTMYHHQDHLPQTICGFQMHAEARALDHDTAAWHDAWAIYTQRFTLVANDPTFREMAMSQQFFMLRPTWVRWIDNRVRFGFRAEWPAPTQASGDPV